MPIFKAIAAFTALATSSSAFAGFSQPMYIVGMDIGNSSLLIIKFDQIIVPCSVPRAYVARSQPYYQDMLAMALSAYAANKPIRVWIDDCNDPSGHSVAAVRMIMGDYIW